ncbi:hypothetical protein BBJ28_00001391 [Nothophytophthora sp. Chile5]|nr:hypothetical protein BBJ28_00001391 [Nothophytophthora sp. Chile5]
MDHVNYSPLHQSSLGLEKSGNSRRASDGSKLRGQVRRLLYDGSKLFWRVNETLELCIYEDVTANCVTIRAFPQKPLQQSEALQQSFRGPIPAVDVDLRRLRQALGLDPVPKTSGQPRMVLHRHLPGGALSPKAKMGAGAPPDHSGELIAKYLLARLQARHDPLNRVELVLHKLHDNEVDPATLLLTSEAGPSMVQAPVLPTDLVMRRRHTIDDVKAAQKEVSVAAARLKNARMKAEELSNLARMTLDAFSRRHTVSNPANARLAVREQANVAAMASSASDVVMGMSGGGRRYSTVSNKPAAAWLRAYDRVVLQNAVERSKEVLQQYPQQQEHIGPIDSSR